MHPSLRRPALLLTLLALASAAPAPVARAQQAAGPSPNKTAVRMSAVQHGAIVTPTALPGAAMSVRPAPAPATATASPEVTILNGSGNGWPGLDFNHSGGYTPPDNQGAAGPSSYIETVNQAIAIYSPKGTGVMTATNSLDNFFWVTGGLPHASAASGHSDPIIAYNDRIGRFIVIDQDVDFTNHVSSLDVAVSKSSAPGSLNSTDWSFFAISTTESGYDADYPGNMGYNYDATVFTLNMFPVSTTNYHAMVIAVSNAGLSANVTPAYYRTDVTDFSLRPTTMHDAAPGDPMWIVTEHGTGTSIDVIKMTNVLTNAPTFAYTNLAVTAYSMCVPPLNPNGTVITTDIDSRILKAAEWNRTLVAAHHVAVSATQDVVQWYAFDVSGATPVLQQQGRISAGPSTYLTYPGIDVNAVGQFGVSFIRSGNDNATDYMSMYITGRTATDPLGAMGLPLAVPAGSGFANYSDFAGGRAGDMSGINVDPVDDSFWAANQFANNEAYANWGTAVANFSVNELATPTQLAFVSADAAPDHVTLQWYGDGSVASASVERRVENGTWATLGTTSPDGSGLLTYRDASVTPGTSYEYRLGVDGAGGTSYYGDTWVSVPVSNALSLSALDGQTGKGARFAVSVPAGAPATLTLVDVTGRIVDRAAVSGSATVGLGGASLRSGVYWARLTQGARSVTTRTLVIR